MYMDGMGDKAAREWALVLHAQHGIVAKAQARRAGLSAKTVRHQLRSGRWRYIRRGVYATFTGELKREARLWVAIRRAGPGAMLSHETAAEVQGLIGKPSVKIHVTVPWRRRPAQKKPIQGVVIHRSDQSRPQHLPPWELPRTCIEDTVLDLVAVARSFDEAYRWVSRATFRHLTTAAMLRAALANRSRMRWRVWLTDALADVADGVQSPLELRYTRDVERAHGLPKAQHQARREIDGHVHYKDNWYSQFRVCVEIDGPTYHQNEQVSRDKRRDNLNLAEDDTRTFRFGPVEVTELACESAAMVAATLRRNGWQGKPHPCRRTSCVLRPTTQMRDTLSPSGGSKYPASSLNRQRDRH
jgi:putative AbiEi antitoxin of type IV toxin-antitoxin system